MTDITTVKQRFGIIGTSPLLDRALEVALRVAPTDLTVLVTGESGVGKEFFPQVIHAYSARKHNKYIAVNCAAIPEGTIDSELFGHEKGAFTGALEARKGYFEEADGGTIFLDEVAELPHSTQARLLRVLQTGEFIRVGSSKVQKTNVRVVAATNVNLQEAIAKGRFREDLYYRLGTVPILVPSLRERPEDIPLLFRRFAADVADTPAREDEAIGESIVVEACFEGVDVSCGAVRHFPDVFACMVAGEVVHAAYGITFVALAACGEPERYLFESVGPVDRDAHGGSVADDSAVVRHGIGQGAVRCGKNLGGEFSRRGGHYPCGASCQQQATRYPVLHFSVVLIGLHKGNCVRRGSVRKRRVLRLSRRKRRGG